MKAVDLRATVAALDRFWSQHTVGEANGNLFKVAKGIDSTNWHSHAAEDEVFIILRGSLVMHLRSGDVHLGEGDFFIVPAGVEHCPHAPEEVHLLLVGPSVTSNEAGGKPDWSNDRSAAT